MYQDDSWPQWASLTGADVYRIIHTRPKGCAVVGSLGRMIQEKTLSVLVPRRPDGDKTPA